MQTMLRSLLAISFLGGAALFLCPPGGPKRVMNILLTAILTAVVLTPLRSIDYDYLTMAEAKLHSAEAGIAAESRQRIDRLKKQFFLQNCERYIRTHAEELGLSLREISIEVIPVGEESWVPYAVEIEAAGSPESMEILCQLIRNDLGIPAERQVWSVHE